MAQLARLDRLRVLIAPIAAITMFGVAISMSHPLFALMLERLGVSGTMIGVNAMAAAVSMILCAPVMPFILRRIGIGPLMIVAAVALAGLMLLIPLYQNFWFWTGLRLFYSFAATALFFTSEYWIVASAPEVSRGRIIAIYALCVSGGFALGPAILSFTGLDGMLPFIVAAGVLLAGLGPIMWGLSAAPESDGEEPPSPLSALRVFASDPGVVFAVVLFGTVEFGALALMAAWGVRNGFTEADAAILLAVFAVGAMALQMPLGWAADRFDRRRVLVVVAAGTGLAPLGMAAAGQSFWLTCAFAALWGAISVGLYSVALTEMGARYSGTKLSIGTAAIILGYGSGALFSPILFGWAMDVIPPNGMLYASAASAAAYLALMLARLIRGRRQGQRRGRKMAPPG